MPRLSDLTDYQIPQPEEVPADLPRVYINGQGIENKKEEKGTVQKITDRLLGLNGEERYQLWPEKVVREGLTAAGDVMSGATPQWAVDPATGDVHTSPQMVEKAQAISALAGTGGLAGPTDATLGAAPFLRPALKYKDRLYKGKEGQSHQDVIPEALYPEFNRMAMSGEDISHYNFGFHNDKGHFLNREDALKYGIDTGLIDPQAGKFGALTSTLMADSSKPGTAIEAMAKSEPFFSALEHNVAKINQSKMTGDQWLGTLSNKPGVKPEELDWTGLKSYLQENGKASVTKEQIESHLEANKVELKEVSKGELKFNKNSEYALPEVIKAAKESGDTPGELEMVLANDGNAYRALTKKFPQLAEDEDWAAKVSQSVFGGDTMPTGSTKYHSYQLPGASNYREMLLTLPKKVKDDVVPSPTASAKYLKDWEALVAEDKRLRPLVDDYNRRLTGDQWNKARDDLAANNKKMDDLHNQMVEDTMKENPGKYGDPYKSSHWDEPNILAHVRMNDRVMSEPGYRITNLKSGNTSKTFPTYDEALTYANSLPESLKKNIQINEGVSPKKSLHLEEIQSDWHQQGRERGYKDGSFPTVERDLSNARSNLENIMSDIRKEHNLISAENSLRQVNDRDLRAKMVEQRANAYNSSDKYKNALAEVKRLEEDAAKAASGVPDAPFKKTWHELALKRMIREAAEKGYDRLSWTPGEAQAARYDLSKQVNMLSASGPDKNGKYLVYIEGKDKQPLFRNQNGFSDHGQKVMNADEIESTVGKEPAKKLIEGAAKNKNNEKTNGFFDLKDENLKIGGEGMKGFYDQIIPKSLERIGKEHGVKVKTYSPKKVEASQEEINKLAKTLYETYARKGGEPPWERIAPDVQEIYRTRAKEKSHLVDNPEHTVHYIDIPQSLKNTALHKGFPLFSSTHMFTPIAGNPFEKKK